MRALLIATLLVLSTGGVAHADATGAEVSMGARHTAPTTAAGYAKMFSRVPRAQWGAADLTISTRLRDGRRVWLFGDTLSQNKHGYLRFVHSTAMVQTADHLSVSHRGAQVLPNQSQRRIYWIETVRTVGPNRVRVKAALMNVTPNDPWGFTRARAQSREADLVVTKAGDVNFAGWRSWVTAPDVGDGADFKVLGDHHFTYGEYVHSIRLSDGGWLKTVNQNWDDALTNHMDKRKRVRFTDYRPMFRESSTRNSPYYGR